MPRSPSSRLEPWPGRCAVHGKKSVITVGIDLSGVSNATLRKRLEDAFEAARKEWSKTFDAKRINFGFGEPAAGTKPMVKAAP